MNSMLFPPSSLDSSGLFSLSPFDPEDACAKNQVLSHHPPEFAIANRFEDGIRGRHGSPKERIVHLCRIVVAVNKEGPMCSSSEATKTQFFSCIWQPVRVSTVHLGLGRDIICIIIDPLRNKH